MVELYLRNADDSKEGVCMDNGAWFDGYYDLGKIRITKSAAKMIHDIDGSEYVGEGRVKSKFTGAAIPIYEISTGCKTAINVMTFKDKVFYAGECGTNVMTEIFKLDRGKIMLDHFNMPRELNNKVDVIVGNKHIIVDNLGDIGRKLFN